MKNNLAKDSSGIAHLGLILIIVLVVGVVGFGAYRVIDANRDDAVVTELTDEDVQAIDDEDDSNAENTTDQSDGQDDTSKAENKNEKN